MGLGPWKKKGPPPECESQRRAFFDTLRAQPLPGLFQYPLVRRPTYPQSWPNFKHFHRIDGLRSHHRCRGVRHPVLRLLLLTSTSLGSAQNRRTARSAHESQHERRGSVGDENRVCTPLGVAPFSTTRHIRCQMPYNGNGRMKTRSLRMTAAVRLAPSGTRAMSNLDPEQQRRFALRVVRRLRKAGFTAYWAGGCVRDLLLGRVPKDYDVATDARPEQVRELFGHRRTLAVGEAFGVIVVLGPRGAGQVEVATFRRDDRYSDGRHPDRVYFSNDRQDALRRDFTINGLFYDPDGDRVIDYVGGREDLQRGIIRAIGNPFDRFAEDKLRMLRAVRFAAVFGFAIEEQTLAAIREMASQITTVSAERIAGEMELALQCDNRAAAVEMLLHTGLADAVLPEIVPRSPTSRARLEENLLVMRHLRSPTFPAAMAALLHGIVRPDQVGQIARRWRLSNQYAASIRWLLEHYHSLDRAPENPWSTVQPVLVDPRIDQLVNLLEARAQCNWASEDVLRWIEEKRRIDRAVLDPPPLLTGNDLIERGVPRGPIYGRLLHQVRCAQLDGQISTKEQAIDLVDRLLSQQEGGSSS